MRKISLFLILVLISCADVDPDPTKEAVEMAGTELKSSGGRPVQVVEFDLSECEIRDAERKILATLLGLGAEARVQDETINTLLQQAKRMDSVGNHYRSLNLDNLIMIRGLKDSIFIRAGNYGDRKLLITSFFVYSQEEKSVIAEGISEDQKQKVLGFSEKMTHELLVQCQCLKISPR